VSRSTTSTNMQDYCGPKAIVFGRPRVFESKTLTAPASLARVLFAREAGELFRDFSEVTFKTYFLYTTLLPLIGKLLPRSLESQLAARWGWHLWIYATK